MIKAEMGRSRFASATDCSVLFGGFIATMPGSDLSGPCVRSNTGQVSARTAEICVIHNSIKIDSAIQSTPHSLPGRGLLERLHSRWRRSEQTRAGRGRVARL